MKCEDSIFVNDTSMISNDLCKTELITKAIQIMSDQQKIII